MQEGVKKSYFNKNIVEAKSWDIFSAKFENFLCFFCRLVLNRSLETPAIEGVASWWPKLFQFDLLTFELPNKS